MLLCWGRRILLLIVFFVVVIPALRDSYVTVL